MVSAYHDALSGGGPSLLDLPRFRLSPAEAEVIWDQVATAARRVPKHMAHLGAPEADVRWVTNRMLVLAHPELCEVPVVSKPERRRSRQP